jgi:FkbM family methyltransferase
MSYSQSGEDHVIESILGARAEGFYVDVGAYDGTELSNTRLFYDRGWTGINIEPHPGSFERLAATRPRDVNLNVALGAERGEMIFYLTEPKPLSTFNKHDVDRQIGVGYIRQVAQVRVPVQTLTDVLAEHAAGKVIDFLSIDAEGYEALVLAGYDWTQKPKLLVIEHEVSGRNTTAEWEHLVLRQGYRRNCVVGCNTFYVVEQ